MVNVMEEFVTSVRLNLKVLFSIQKKFSAFGLVVSENEWSIVLSFSSFEIPAHLPFSKRTTELLTASFILSMQTLPVNIEVLW